MCDESDEVGIFSEPSPKVGLEGERSVKSTADYLASLPGISSPSLYIGYGKVSRDDKVLIAVTNYQDRALIEAIVQALKAKGARGVDVLTLDEGEERELNYTDEIRVIVRKEPWWANPRWYDYEERVLNYAKDNGYTFLIHGKGGPMPTTNHLGEHLPFKFEAIPWNTKEQFLDGFATFPPKLNELINKKTWRMIYKLGRGGKVRVTDPEGTDIQFTLNEKYFDRPLDDRGGFGPEPKYGHLLSHPTPPILAEDDTSGVVAGTTSHLTRPFPSLKVHLDSSRIEEIEGGGEYGKNWKGLYEDTSDVQYPEFPKKGLFWLWEMAIGTNPKVKRQSDVLRIGSGGNEWERRRSGIIHCGFGTRWRGPSEKWAGEKGIPYGHLHIHLLFPTYEIKTTTGASVTVIENGRLKALDDPEVREMAKKYGDPDKILSEDWIPRVPGINAAGSYEQYGNEPAEWIKKNG